MSARSPARLLWTSAALCFLLAQGVSAVAAGPSFGSGKDGVSRTSGTVVSIAGQAVELKFEGSQLTFHAPKGSKALLETTAQLAPDDNVTIAWTQKDGKKWIQAVEGRGTVQGLVTGKTNALIEVKPEAGKAQRFSLVGPGGMPPTAGTPEAAVLKRLARAGVGDKVRLTWEITTAGKQAVDVKFLARAAEAKSGSGKAAPPKAHAPGNTSMKKLRQRARKLANH